MDEAAREVNKFVAEIDVLKERIRAEEAKRLKSGQDWAKVVAGLEAQLWEGQAERKRMHNLIQELREMCAFLLV